MGQDFVSMPVNLCESKHWTLLVLDLRKRGIDELLDSKATSFTKPSFLAPLVSLFYFTQLWDCKGMETNHNNWTIKHLPSLHFFLASTSWPVKYFFSTRI